MKDPSSREEMRLAQTHSATRTILTHRPVFLRAPGSLNTLNMGSRWNWSILYQSEFTAMCTKIKKTSMRLRAHLKNKIPSPLSYKTKISHAFQFSK